MTPCLALSMARLLMRSAIDVFWAWVPAVSTSENLVWSCVSVNLDKTA